MESFLALESLTDKALLVGMSSTRIAVAFLLRHPATILPVLGTNSLERIAKISDGATVALSRSQWFQLYEAALGQEVP